MRILAIGDIHGCNTALTALLQQVQPGPDDQLIFLGDYIDRGRATRSVIDTLIQLPATCATVFLRGNHEAMMLEARTDTFCSDGWQGCGGLETLYSYEAQFRPNWPELIPAAHWKFFESTIRHFETDTHIFVHAGVNPTLDLTEQPDWVVYWSSFFELKTPHKSGKKIICGHTTQITGMISDVGHAICLDTGAAYGGWLTCLDVNSGKYWQANERGARRDGMLWQK